MRHIFLLILIILSSVFAKNHRKTENIIYHNVGDKARGMKDWDYGRSNGEWCDGLSVVAIVKIN